MKMEAKTESQNAATNPARSMSTREQRLVKQKNGRLKKRPYLHIQFGVRNLAHFSWNSLNVRSVILFAHGQLSQKQMPRLLTVMHTLPGGMYST